MLKRTVTQTTVGYSMKSLSIYMMDFTKPFEKRLVAAGLAAKNIAPIIEQGCMAPALVAESIVATMLYNLLFDLNPDFNREDPRFLSLYDLEGSGELAEEVLLELISEAKSKNELN